jgi:hypothetical protein
MRHSMYSALVRNGRLRRPRAGGGDIDERQRSRRCPSPRAQRTNLPMHKNLTILPSVDPGLEGRGSRRNSGPDHVTAYPVKADLGSGRLGFRPTCGVAGGSGAARVRWHRPRLPLAPDWPERAPGRPLVLRTHRRQLWLRRPPHRKPGRTRLGRCPGRLRAYARWQSWELHFLVRDTGSHRQKFVSVTWENAAARRKYAERTVWPTTPCDVHT